MSQFDQERPQSKIDDYPTKRREKEASEHKQTKTHTLKLEQNQSKATSKNDSIQFICAAAKQASESVIVLCFVVRYFMSLLRELFALLCLSSWCLVMVVWLFLAVPWVGLQFVIVVFTDHTHYFRRFFHR